VWCVVLVIVFRFVLFVLQNIQYSAAMPSAIVLLSEGAEEMETVISVDVLRRGGVRDWHTSDTTATF